MPVLPLPSGTCFHIQQLLIEIPSFFFFPRFFCPSALGRGKTSSMLGESCSCSQLLRTLCTRAVRLFQNCWINVLIIILLGCTSRMSESLNTLNSPLSENDATLMVGDGLTRVPGCEPSSCSAAFVGLSPERLRGAPRPHLRGTQPWMQQPLTQTSVQDVSHRDNLSLSQAERAGSAPSILICQ